MVNLMLKSAGALFLLSLWVPLRAQQLVYVVHWSNHFSENGELVREDSTHLYYSDEKSIFPSGVKKFWYESEKGEYALVNNKELYYDSQGRLVKAKGIFRPLLSGQNVFYNVFYYGKAGVDSVVSWKKERKNIQRKSFYFYTGVILDSSITISYSEGEITDYYVFQYFPDGRIRQYFERYKILDDTGEDMSFYYYNSEGLLDSCIDGNYVLKPVEYDFYDNVLSNDILANVQMMGFLPPEDIVSYLLPLFGFKRVVGRVYDDEYGEGRYEMTVNVKYVSETGRIEELVMTEEYANETFQEKYVFYFRGDSSRLFREQVQEPLIWNVELVGEIFLESSLPIDRVELISAGGNIIFIKKIYGKTNFSYDASRLPAGKYFLAVYNMYGHVKLLPITIKE